MLKVFFKEKQTKTILSLLTLPAIATVVIDLFLYSPRNQNFSVTNSILCSFLSPFKSVTNLHIFLSGSDDVLGD